MTAAQRMTFLKRRSRSPRRTRRGNNGDFVDCVRTGSEDGASISAASVRCRDWWAGTTWLRSALTQLRSLWGDLSSTTSLTYLLQSRAVSARHSGTAVVQWTAGAARSIRLTLIIVLHCILMVGIALRDKPAAWEQPLDGVQMDVCTANSTLMWLAERV